MVTAAGDGVDHWVFLCGEVAVLSLTWLVVHATHYNFLAFRKAGPKPPKTVIQIYADAQW